MMTYIMAFLKHYDANLQQSLPQVCIVYAFCLDNSCIFFCSCAEFIYACLSLIKCKKKKIDHGFVILFDCWGSSVPGVLYGSPVR